MITVLSMIFIPDRGKTDDTAVRRRFGILCGAAGIFLNILLFGGKLTAGILSSSIAITADAINNLSDAGSSLITLIGFKWAGQAPDTEHPFGHGRIEYISGLIVSFLIILMGLELVRSSAEKILHPAPIESSPLILTILVASILVKLYMYFYNKTLGARLNSAAMHATALDSLSDSAATTAVLAATLIGHFTDLFIDGWCGILVACFILYSGISAARETISPLLGQPPEPDFVQRIEGIVMSHDEVCGMHDLIVHNYGPGRTMISLHAEVSAHGDILALHDAIDNIEQELRTTLHCDAVIHMDPIVTDDPAVTALRDTITREVKAIDDTLTIHDFRVVAGPTHSNVIFDILLPYHFHMSEQDVKRRIEDFIAALPDHSYKAVIQLDHSYVNCTAEETKRSKK